MLVLSRKPAERIRIGDSVVLTILSIRGNQARIGIEAPREIRVLRSELQDQDYGPRLDRALVDAAPAKLTESAERRGIDTWESEGGAAA